jgi:hypothetical protein
VVMRQQQAGENEGARDAADEHMHFHER